MFTVPFPPIPVVLPGTVVENGNLLAPVVIMTYPKYCRYRAVLKRIETVSEAWLKNVLVMAIGGLTSMQRGMRVMFCREVFEYRDLEDLDFHLEHLGTSCQLELSGESSVWAFLLWKEHVE